MKNTFLILLISVLFFPAIVSATTLTNNNFLDKNGSVIDKSFLVLDATQKPKPDLDGLKLEELTCEKLFKDGNEYNSTWELLNTSLRFMQYLSIIIALVLSFIDFIKVIPLQDKEALFKSISSAATRLGIALLIFFVPIILDFVLELVGFSNPTCGLF